MYDMNIDADKSLYYQTVQTFLNYAPRITALATLNPAMMDHRLATNIFSAGENLVIAQGFILRTIYPVLGQTCPELSTETATTGRYCSATH